MSAAEAWPRLAAEGLVDGERPQAGTAVSPWYVRTMLGVAGWMAALFLSGFIGAAFAFVMDSAGAALVTGCLLCGGAALMFHKFDANDFAEQFALVVSLLGQVLIGVGIGQSLNWENGAFPLAFAAVQTGLALAVPNFLHRVLAAAGAAVFLALGINQLELHGLTAPLLCAGVAWIWIEPARWASGGRLWRPIGYGLVLALLLVETFRLTGTSWLLGVASDEPSWMLQWGPLIGRTATAAILVATAVMLARREGLTADRKAAVAATGAAAAIALISLGAPGLGSTLVILLLGQGAGNRLLVALGVLSLLGFVAHFYYSLHLTLLEKSGLLAVTGLLLLAGHWLLRRHQPPGEAAHA